MALKKAFMNAKLGIEPPKAYQLNSSQVDSETENSFVAGKANGQGYAIGLSCAKC